MKRLFTFILTLLVATIATAQSTTASLKGFVTDGNGKPLVGATVVATHTPTETVYGLAANAFDEDVQRSMQAGLNAHLSKPVEPDTLYNTLKSLIKS